jgi:hypothetical protein
MRRKRQQIAGFASDKETNHRSAVLRGGFRLPARLWLDRGDEGVLPDRLIAVRDIND